MVITSTHGQAALIERAYARVQTFFSWLKSIAAQLTEQESWELIVAQSMAFFMGKDPPKNLSHT
jgi:hypothetical protein